MFKVKYLSKLINVFVKSAYQIVIILNPFHVWRATHWTIFAVLDTCGLALVKPILYQQGQTFGWTPSSSRSSGIDKQTSLRTKPSDQLPYVARNHIKPNSWYQEGRQNFPDMEAKLTDKGPATRGSDKVDNLPKGWRTQKFRSV